MHIEFTSADLRSLDELTDEAIGCAVWSDERPFRGVAGSIDWRLAGTLSELARSGYLSGALDEVLLVPGRPRLPFGKVLLFGAGRCGAFDDEAFRRVVMTMLRTLRGLRVHRTVLELPGRGDDLIDAEHAVHVLLECAQADHLDDAFRLVEPSAERDRIALRVRNELRRRRA